MKKTIVTFVLVCRCGERKQIILNLKTGKPSQVTCKKCKRVTRL